MSTSFNPSLNTLIHMVFWCSMARWSTRRSSSNQRDRRMTTAKTHAIKTRVSPGKHGKAHHGIQGRVRRQRVLVERSTQLVAQPRRERCDWKDLWNVLVSKAQSKVKHSFLMMKHQLGYCKVRYRVLERNRFDVCLMLMACNLKRSMWLGSKSLEPVPRK